MITTVAMGVWERGRHDHGILVAGGMALQVRNGPHSPEFHDRGILFIVWADRDHGSGVPGAWRIKSETVPAAAARPHPARTCDITDLCGTDRANRPPKRPKVMISRLWRRARSIWQLAGPAGRAVRRARTAR